MESLAPQASEVVAPKRCSFVQQPFEPALHAARARLRGIRRDLERSSDLRKSFTESTRARTLSVCHAKLASENSE